MSILSKIAANKIISDYSITDPNEIPIEKLVFAEGALLQEKKMSGALGRIVFGKTRAIITINKSISSIQQKRFVIAHEFGHYKLHKNLQQFYNCSEAAFLEWHKKGNHEFEANQFAAELLMPSSIFKEKCAGNKFSTGLIKRLTEEFNTSLTSTAIRYTEHGNNPLLIVFCKDNIVRWLRSSEDFPLQFVNVNTTVPPRTIAYEYFKNGSVPKQPDLIRAIDWFASDFNIDQYRNWKFYEECIVFKSINAVMSFIWTF